MSEGSIATIRRLPVYLVLDCSGSMAGEPIAAMEMGLKALLSDLRNDPQALETVWLSVITFASAAEPIVPLTDIGEFDPPDLAASGTTALGEAIDLLAERINQEVRKTTPDQKGDWKPMVFLLTDGEPTDSWEKPVEKFRVSGLATLIACGAGPEVNDATLKRIGDKVVRLKDTQPGTLGAFMKWVTASVTTASQVLGARPQGADQLPDLPQDKGITLMF
jgi:uncharacterized protein YegL